MAWFEAFALSGTRMSSSKCTIQGGLSCRWAHSCAFLVLFWSFPEISIVGIEYACCDGSGWGFTNPMLSPLLLVLQRRSAPLVAPNPVQVKLRCVLMTCCSGGSFLWGGTTGFAARQEFVRSVRAGSLFWGLATCADQLLAVTAVYSLLSR